MKNPSMEKYYYDVKHRAFDILGGKCAKCGHTDPTGLQVNHIQGRKGLEDPKESGIKVYLKIVKGQTEGYQLLCANCRMINQKENKVYPSKKISDALNTYIDSLDIPKILAEAPERDMGFKLKCFKCGSGNAERRMKIYGKATNGYVIEPYKCSDCNYSGFYKAKREP